MKFMKKIFVLAAWRVMSAAAWRVMSVAALCVTSIATLCTTSVAARAQQPADFPQWLQTLESQNAGLIDSTAYYPAHPSAPDYRTYVVYFHQPLEHATPGSGQFPMRALITVNTKNDPTTAVNHVYCSGYSIVSNYVYNSPDSVFAKSFDCMTEIAHRYQANFIQIEHRYFQYSAPSQCWTNLDYLRAEEAAEDFHNLFEALKTVLKGKWVMSGVSKGGITTLLQHTFYPNDMDIYVPYAAPFFRTDRDTVMQQYLYNHGWDKEYRDWFMAVRKAALAGAPAQLETTNTIWPIFLKMNAQRYTQPHLDSLFCYYMGNAAYFGFNERAYSDTASVRKQFAKNDSIIQSYNWQSYNWQSYNDTVLAYLITSNKLQLDSIGKWLDTLRKYPDKQLIPGRRFVRNSYRPFGIREEEWWGAEDKEHIDNARAYEYQAKRELGFYDYRFDMLAPTPEDAAVFNAYWKAKAGCMLDIYHPYYASLTYNPALYDRVMTATQAATKPIVLIYGEDDPWTGAAVKDEFINGNNVKKFILPAQNHTARFTSDTDKAQCDAIRAAIEAVLGTPEGWEETPSDSPSRGEKVLRDGQLLIKRGEKTYTVTGSRIH